MQVRNYCRPCAVIALLLLSLAATLSLLASHQRGHADEPLSKTAPAVSSRDTSVAPLPASQAQAAFGRLPLGFEASAAKAAEARFIARGNSYQLTLAPTEAVLRFRQQEAVLRMRLQGGRRTARGAGVDELPGRSNYLIGRDPGKWRTEVAQFARVRYAGVYPGVDVVYYGTGQQLEYDFVVAPGADANTIKLAFDGAEALHVDQAGELVLQIAGSEVRQRRPVIYQEADGARQPVEGGFVQTGAREVGFALGAYDSTRPLVIDPVILFSTFLGGSGVDSGTHIALDAAGNIYVIGSTGSPNFPVTPGALRTRAAPQQDDVFISKLNPAGTALIYSTYLGSDAGSDVAAGLALDRAGQVYLIGRTASPDFPVTPNALPTAAASNVNAQAFVAQLNANGTGLVYSTLIGGDSDDGGRAIALDAADNIYVLGFTLSRNLPVTDGALQQTLGNTVGGNAFLAKFTASRSLSYCTYYGGGNVTYGQDLAVDDAGNAYLVGSSNGPQGQTPANLFVTKINAAGSATLFEFTPAKPSNQYAEALGITRDKAGNLYVTGYSTGGIAATAGAFQAAGKGFPDVFVMKLSATGALIYFTYLGGTDNEVGSQLAVDDAGNAWVVGWTTSADFPVRDAVQNRYNGGGLPFGDGFVSKLNADGTALLFSTYLGETGNDYVNDIALDQAGNAYIIGGTDSGAFSVTPGAAQINFGGQFDSFIAKLGEGRARPVTVSAASYMRAGITPEAIVAAFGADLAVTTQVATTIPLPTVLAGTRVTVRDRAGTERVAPLFFVSPNQINYLVPTGTVPGAATVRVTNDNGASAESVIFVELVGPALFTANVDGAGVPAGLVLRVKPDGTQSYESIVNLDPTGNRFVPRPLAFGQDELFLLLFGSGIRLRSSLSAVQVFVGQTVQSALYAGPQGDFVGLDQINVRLPRSFAGAGEINVQVRADAKSSNTVRLAFH